MFYIYIFLCKNVQKTSLFLCKNVQKTSFDLQNFLELLTKLFSAKETVGIWKHIKIKPCVKKFIFNKKLRQSKNLDWRFKAFYIKIWVLLGRLYVLYVNQMWEKEGVNVCTMYMHVWDWKTVFIYAHKCLIMYIV